MQIDNNSSIPPFVNTIYLLFTLCTVVISFLSESKGISSTLGISSYIFLVKPSFKATSTSAVSVGSPFNSPLSEILVSLHNIPLYTNNFISWFAFSYFVISSIFVMSYVTSFTYIFWTVILFCVKVPVLSEHITELLPKVSTAGKCFTIAFFFTIFWTPIAKTIVDTAANPSGIAATAKLTAVINIDTAGFPCIKPAAKIITHIIIAAIPSVFPKLFNFSWSGVSFSSWFDNIPAIFPTSVFIPVSTTIAFPLP